MCGTTVHRVKTEHFKYCLFKSRNMVDAGQMSTSPADVNVSHQGEKDQSNFRVVQDL